MTSLKLLAMCLLLTVVVSQSIVDRIAEIKFAKDMDRLKGYGCKTPQPKSLSVYTLIKGEDISTGEDIMPHSTILHRCEESGLCLNNFPCTAVEEEEVELTIKIINVVDKSHPYRFISIMATNHTRCSCRDSNSIHNN